ncbi:MAG: M23 family metallopeptidase [Bauldia sp.]|nr:M23 family metallopeptidase [Bauldia sp.]
MKFSTAVLGLVVVFSPCFAAAADFKYFSPGDLEPNSGAGYKNSTIYFPDIRFPLEQGPAYLNSQVYRPGGSHKIGSQCDNSNYEYPWRDNYCETRGWSMPLCPAGKGHQGQDIRPSKCKADLYWAVAVDDGVVANIGTYSVTLQTRTGTLYRYLHLNMSDLAVDELDRVTKGQRIGKVSNWFGDTKTTIHLHFDVKDTLIYKGKRQILYVSPYTSLINSYTKLIGD